MKLSRYLTPDSESPGFIFWKVTQLWQKHISEALVPYNISHMEFVILACTYWLDHNEIPVTQITLAKEACLEPQTVSQVLKRVEKSGYIIREINSRDSRAKTVHLSPVGLNLVQKTIPIVEETDAEFFTQLPQSIGHTLAKLLPK